MKKQDLIMRFPPKIDGPKKPLPEYPSPPTDGKFVIRCEAEIWIETFQIKYLHKDGRWRHGATRTKDGKEEYSGYYDTRKEARQALKRARETYRVEDRAY